MASKPLIGAFSFGIVCLLAFASVPHHVPNAVGQADLQTLPATQAPPVLSGAAVGGRSAQIGNRTSTDRGEGATSSGRASVADARATTAPADGNATVQPTSGGAIPLASATRPEVVGTAAQRITPTRAIETPAAPSISASSPLFPNVYLGFQGIASTGWVPPDVQIAVGPNHVMELVNGGGEIWSKSGTVLSTFSLGSFFGAGTDYIGDPKILYDAPSGRWFATIMDITAGSYTIAVSTTSDPTGTWTRWTFVVGACLDQPILGISDDKVVVSVNEFSTYGTSCGGSWLGAAYWVLNKANLVAGSSVWYSPFGPSTGLASLHPVQSITSTTTQYMVSSGYNAMTLFSITGTPPGAVAVTSQTLAISLSSGSPNAPQPGTSYLLDTGDVRIQDAVWNAGNLWLGLNDGCTPSGDTQLRSCVHLTEIDTTAMVVRNDFDYGAAGMYYFYPALRTDRYGDLVVVFGYSSSSSYPGIMVTLRTWNDPAGFLQSPWILESGSGAETGYCTFGVCRYGDYFGAAVDPSNPALVWVAGEYGSPTGWKTYIDEVRVEVAETLSYSVLDGGSGYSAPTLTYQFSGAYYGATLSTLPTTYYVDAGSYWWFDTTLSGSTSTERWQSPYVYGIADVSAESIVLPYYHQFLTDFVHVVAGGGSIAPQVTYIQLGLSTARSADFSDWVDAGTSYAYANPISSGTAGERWYSPSVAGTVSSASTVAVVYYHQFAVTVSYSVVDGGSPAAPTLSGTSAGSPITVSLAGSPSSVWLDRGSLYSVTNPLAGSSVGERWQANSTTSATVSAAVTQSFGYYHQYLLGFGYSIVGGGSGYAAPTVTYTRFGTASSMRANGSDWVDAGSVYAFPLLLGGSNSSVRWMASLPTNGTASAPSVVVVVYYAQQLVDFRYSVVGGGTGYSAPDVTYTRFGRMASLRANGSDWVDAGTQYDFPMNLTGSTSSERWQASAGSSGTVGSSTTLVATYQHEFVVTFELNRADAGIASAVSGWYAAGSMVPIRVTANYGWQFERWIGSGIGSYSGSEGASYLTVSGVIHETAVFDAGLTISCTDGGIVTYSYGNVTGSISARARTTIYVPPGTRVSLTETPSFSNDFAGWGGASSGTNATVTVVVASPGAVSATFAANLAVQVGLVVLPIVAVLAGVAFLLVVGRKRRRGRTPPVAEEEEL